MQFKSATQKIVVDGMDVSVESNLFLGRELLSLAMALLRIVVPYMKALGGIKKVTSNEEEENKNKTDSPSSDLGESMETEMLSKIERLKGYTLTPDFWKVITDQIVFTLDDKRMLDLVFRLLKGTRINGQEVSKPELFDAIFQGNLGFLVEVLKFIIERNFASFLTGSSIGLILSKIANNTATPQDMSRLDDALRA